MVTVEAALLPAENCSWAPFRVAAAAAALFRLSLCSEWCRIRTGRAQGRRSPSFWGRDGACVEGEGRRTWRRRRRRESERGKEAAWSWLESRASEGRAAVADSCRLLNDPASIALSGYQKLAFTPLFAFASHCKP